MPDWSKSLIYVNSPAGRFPTLSDQNTAIHLTLHAIHLHGLTGSKWLIDIYKLLQKNPHLSEIIINCDRSGALLIYIVENFFGIKTTDRSQTEEHTFMERIVVSASENDINIPGLRIFLSTRSLPRLNDKALLLKETILPSSDVLDSVYHTDKPQAIKKHLSRITQSIKGLIEASIKTLRE
ncbi:MAG: hypothetical protein JKX97_05100 [Candidatus Lindowbacteria bacterium]|nr:hypothetical protein [Candidatus Lindowbacteria bacterium]